MHCGEDVKDSPIMISHSHPLLWTLLCCDPWRWACDVSCLVSTERPDFFIQIGLPVNVQSRWGQDRKTVDREQICSVAQ